MLEIINNSRVATTSTSQPANTIRPARPTFKTVQVWDVWKDAHQRRADRLLLILAADNTTVTCQDLHSNKITKIRLKAFGYERNSFVYHDTFASVILGRLEARLLMVTQSCNSLLLSLTKMDRALKTLANR